jgi:hypothetical protein
MLGPDSTWIGDQVTSTPGAVRTLEGVTASRGLREGEKGNLMLVTHYSLERHY